MPSETTLAWIAFWVTIALAATVVVICWLEERKGNK